MSNLKSIFRFTIGLEKLKYVKPCNFYCKVYSKSIIQILNKENPDLIDDYNKQKREEKELLHKIIETEWKERIITKEI
jgi:hypothetical protein